jgi:MauM/NapG family ferredoxin protein
MKVASNSIHRRKFFRDALATGAAAAACGWSSGAFRSEAEGGAPPVRPPGALAEEEFLARCIRCQRCADACPNNAILPMDRSQGSGKELTPHIRPRRQTCMLCNKIEGEYLKCTEACPSGALELVRKDPDEIRARVAMGIAEIDLALCYSYNDWSCGACYRACPLPGEAMTLGLWERPEVIAESCIGCGLCERACIRYPQAIRVKTGVVA